MGTNRDQGHQNRADSVGWVSWAPILTTEPVMYQPSAETAKMPKRDSSRY